MMTVLNTYLIRIQYSALREKEYWLDNILTVHIKMRFSVSAISNIALRFQKHLSNRRDWFPEHPCMLSSLASKTVEISYYEQGHWTS